jgi:hypothetical protein
MVSFSRCLTTALSVILTAGCWPLESTLLSAQVNLSQAMAAREMEIYAKARTVVDMTSDELIRAYPKEFSDLEFDDNQEELPSLLRSVSRNVKSLMDGIPNVGSKEVVRCERLRNTLVVESSYSQTYNYLVISGSGGTWEEIRTDNKGRPITPGAREDTFIITSGFAGLVLIFHPGALTNSRFRILGRERAAPNACLVAFAQRPESGQPWGRFMAPLMTAPVSIMYQGFAWVDPQNHQILRMRTDLLAPRHDAMLPRQTTEIRFDEVHFNSYSQAFWLPREVLVTVDYNRQIYRNHHLYSDYLVFLVESRDKLEQPKIKK